MGGLPRRSLAATPRRPLAYKDKRKSKGDDAHSYDDADMTRPQLLNDNIQELMIPTPPYAAESEDMGHGTRKIIDTLAMHHREDAQYQFHHCWQEAGNGQPHGMTFSS